MRAPPPLWRAMNRGGKYLSYVIGERVKIAKPWDKGKGEM